MNSVYFPAHVVVIIRRLVNVVSTLSISNQYLLHQQTLAKPDELPSSHNLYCLKQPFDCLKNVEWPWWAARRNWDMGLCRINTRREIRNSGMHLECESTEISKITFVSFTSIFLATIRLPNWLDNWTWPHLLSFVSLEVNHAQPETDPPPPRPLEPLEPPERPKRENHDKKHQKSPPQDRVELPRQEAKVKPLDIIHQLLVNPALYDPLLIPRYPIVLCHGLFSMCHFLNNN
jgi:triacylglycerol lipase